MTAPVKAPEYTAKVDALLERAAELGFTEEDFGHLAFAAADQASLGSTDEVTLGSHTLTVRWRVQP